MANEQNLRPVRNKQEASMRGKVGGKASAAKRAKIRSFREACRMFLDMDAPDHFKEKVKEHFPNLDDKDINGFVAMVAMQKAKAIEFADTSAFTTIRDTAGEKPVDKFEGVTEVKMMGRIKIDGKEWEPRI